MLWRGGAIEVRAVTSSVVGQSTDVAVQFAMSSASPLGGGAPISKRFRSLSVTAAPRLLDTANILSLEAPTPSDLAPALRCALLRQPLDWWVCATLHYLYIISMHGGRTDRNILLNVYFLFPFKLNVSHETSAQNWIKYGSRLRCSCVVK